ncbi:hypothetical protein M409DRAFT_30209 [Zasmidium cellare ATCC 36951]|uniref:Altered inheritance of mitochondria protein 41 n=1 Tax=Zasmidium cellare ATCC 36951 TaxID=1080233 RepID=A0A6A6BXK7_ZASCE|nr:uncharacterized protein M409DRAFT_30209 [Zasmidium cellare ATCC 36951]KAF2159333.1 hypothetical protein M409DRAFT_30209 [Zasmidium cellare ATCC 36951]
MASKSATMLVRSRSVLRPSYICPQCRFYSTPSPTTLPAPPLLLKLKGDLKTAMKAKDTNRLNALRGLLAEVTNQAKTSNPIKTDMQMLSLLRKRTAAAKAAGDEFKAAGREDLLEKEEAQASIFEEYAGGVETMPESDIKDAVTKVIDEVKAVAEGKVNMGDVLKKILGPGGSLEGKPVDRSEVARIVKQALGQ